MAGKLEVWSAHLRTAPLVGTARCASRKSGRADLPVGRPRSQPRKLSGQARPHQPNLSGVTFLVGTARCAVRSSQPVLRSSTAEAGCDDPTDGLEKLRNREFGVRGHVRALQAVPQRRDRRSPDGPIHRVLSAALLRYLRLSWIGVVETTFALCPGDSGVSLIR